jgi:hypothetical protein
MTIAKSYVHCAEDVDERFPPKRKREHDIASLSGKGTKQFDMARGHDR